MFAPTQLCQIDGNQRHEKRIVSKIAYRLIPFLGAASWPRSSIG